MQLAVKPFGAPGTCVRKPVPVEALQDPMVYWPHQGGSADNSPVSLRLGAPCSRLGGSPSRSVPTGLKVAR